MINMHHLPGYASYSNMERHFFILLANGKTINDKQMRTIIKTITVKQYNILSNIAKDILTGKIVLNKQLFQKFSSKKQFIRGLSRKSVSRKNLDKNFDIIQALSNIYIKRYENGRKVRTNTYRRMGTHHKREPLNEESESGESNCSNSNSELSSDTNTYDTSEHSTQSTERETNHDEAIK